MSEITRGPLPLPDFYDSANAARWSHRPDEQALFSAALAHRAAHRIHPAAGDGALTHLLLVDLQRDFCHPEGTLYVGGRSGTGGVADTDRVARFIYANLDALSTITCTMDTHHPFQIFFASFWVDADGNALQPHREITTEQVRRGEAVPRAELAGWLGDGTAEWLREQALHYCRALEASGRYTLYLWPPHCLLGSEGHALAGVIHEARLFHAYARGAENRIEIKGEAALTENYSVLAPEVRTRFDDPAAEIGTRNDRLVRRLRRADRIIVAGEAASHCVKSTLEDLLSEAPELAGRVYLLTDCTSAVAVPDGRGGLAADFTPQAEEAFARFAAAGVHLVSSTVPVSSWPAAVR